ncbi:ABC transporter permease [Rathayibacter sp. AY1E9]|uniref:ABC transporter permease n=1 Tax=unclassified Rathayibacter TaxID=2609250 RepID=UPI000CE8A145|nr:MULTISPECIES: ABC transporter permease [unclassified Rathayibacter]PPG53578.1 ABC transporter permease [Rathayibacter sp. AY1E9]PPG56586.1 ABC transporter permease [Rathayibacter sp. AY1C5]
MTTTTFHAPSALARLRGRNNEGILLGIIVLVVLAIAVLSPGTLSAGMAADILRGAVVNMALALGLLLVIVSGGIDVSFTAIAIFAAYLTVTVMQSSGIDNALLAFAAATAVGAVVGILNAVLVAGFHLQTLIATLGTQGIVRGALLAFVGATYLSTLPGSLAAVGDARLATVDGSAVSVLLVPVALLAVGLALVLRKTMFGRSVYAIGGAPESARRAGIRVGRVQTIIYVVAGALSGFAGMVHVSLVGHASPFELVGTELNVIAAVVIGGAADTGGRGSVQGVALGVLLLALIQNSLVRLGIPGFWHTLVVGLVILAGVAIQAQTRRLRQARSRVLEGAVA